MPSSYVLGRFQGASSAASNASAASSALAELQQQAQVQRLPKPAKLVAVARELALFLFGGDENDAAGGFSLELAGALAVGLSTLRDSSDNDSRKAARLLYLYISEVVARRRPALPPSDEGLRRINAACAAVLEDASGGHSLYVPRRIVALRTLGTLIGASASPVAAAEKTHKVCFVLIDRSID